MPATEYDVWRDYHQRKGFPSDRLLWAVALVGSRLCNAWISKGSRYKAADFIPRFAHRIDNAALIAQLSALPGAKVRKRPRKEKPDGGR